MAKSIVKLDVDASLHVAVKVNGDVGAVKLPSAPKVMPGTVRVELNEAGEPSPTASMKVPPVRSEPFKVTCDQSDEMERIS